MKLPKGKNKNFEDRTSPLAQAKHYPLSRAKVNTENFNGRYSTAANGQDQAHIPGNLHPHDWSRRAAKEEGLRDSWIPQGSKKNKKSMLERRKKPSSAFVGND